MGARDNAEARYASVIIFLPQRPRPHIAENCRRSHPDITHMGYCLGPHMYKYHLSCFNDCKCLYMCYLPFCYPGPDNHRLISECAGLCAHATSTWYTQNKKRTILSLKKEPMPHILNNPLESQITGPLLTIFKSSCSCTLQLL